MSDPQTRLARLSPQQLRLLARRLKRQASAPTLPVLVAALDERHEPFPLTDIQQAYWIGRRGLFDLGNVSAHSYNEWPMTDLEIGRLSHCLQRLIDRHEMLRAIILPDGRQQILKEVPPYQVCVIDLCGQSAPEVTAHLAALRNEMSHQVLPTERWPLFDVRISLLDDRQALIHLSFDILIGDLWSFRLLLAELQQLYVDPTAELVPIEMSFRDYVMAQKTFETSLHHRRAEEHWREWIKDMPPAPELPMARSVGAITAPRFERRAGQLDAETWRRLQDLAAARGVTPSGLLLGAYATILSLWSKGPRFTLNITTFNRLPIHPHVGRVIGDFTSLTLLAVDMTVEMPFTERVRALQHQLWKNLQYGQVSAVRVMRDLARAEGRAPGAIIPVVFTSLLMESAGGNEMEAAGRREGGAEGLADEAVSAYSISQTPQVWLDHQVGADQGRLVFNWDAVAGLFPEGLLDDMFRAYRRLLDRLLEEPAWSERRFTWLLAEQLCEREKVNATAVPLRECLLHQPFMEQAARRPELPAVLAGDRALTYGELDRLSNQIAHRLLRLGARPNRLVAVVMEKGWQQVAGVLGILKAGSAYLPIDPGLPEERRRYLLEHGEATLAVTQPWLDDRLEWPEGVVRVRIEEYLDESTVALQASQHPEDLAYVIFTSGSTGQPKGVMIDHRGAVNTVLDVHHRFSVGEEDRVLALSSLSFDLSVYDLFGTLAAGGAIVLPEPAARRDPAAWLDLLAKHRVTIWNSVPMLMEILVEYAEGRPEAREAAASLRLALLSGDWLPLSLADRLREFAGKIEVVSLGGATEASIWSILYPIGAVDPAWVSIPYGRPMLNQTFHVLDAGLEPRPTWVPGELYIGGLGLAKGYWRDEERTRASFIVHPATGERLYRTGDLGRYLPNGDIEFLGREDSQVKIGGHRIELGEIEAALAQHPAVRACVVTAAGAARGPLHLVAHVTLVDETEEAVNAELAEARPELRSGAIALARVEGEDLLAEVCHFGRQRELGGLPLTAPEFGRFLASLVQLDLDGQPLGKRRYPSAGHLYPVQVYLYVKPGGVEGIGPGIYYHHPKTHRLVCLAPGAAIDAEALAPAVRPLFESAAFLLFLVARLQAVAPVYGPLAADFCLLEAGYLGQLLRMGPVDGVVVVRPAGSFAFGRLRRLFDLEEDQVLLDVLVGGRAGERWVPAAESEALAAVRASSAWHEMTAVIEESALPSVTGEIDLLEFKLREPGIRPASTRSSLPFEGGRPPEQLAMSFRQRASDRRFLSAPISLGSLGRLLACLADQPVHEPAPARRLYPSSAGSCPVQVLLSVKEERVVGLPGGIYLYGPADHAVVLLAADTAVPREAFPDVNRPVFDEAALVILLLADLGAAQGLHGPSARDLCLIEAGAIGQLLMTAGPEHGIGLCPVGSLQVDPAGILSVPGEVLLHSFLVGRIADRRRLAAAFEFPTLRMRAPATTDELRAFLVSRLPDYMIPSSFLVMNALPLTANGKLDRKALSASAAAGPTMEAVYEEARSPMERRIAELWCVLLGRDKVGIHAPFFSLGGDSVQAVQFLARARQLGIELTAREFFEHQTISRLAVLARALAPDRPEVAASLTAETGPSSADVSRADLSPVELEQLMAEFAEEGANGEAD